MVNTSTERTFGHAATHQPINPLIDDVTRLAVSEVDHRKGATFKVSASRYYLGVINSGHTRILLTYTVYVIYRCRNHQNNPRKRLFEAIQTVLDGYGIRGFRTTEQVPLRVLLAHWTGPVGLLGFRHTNSSIFQRPRRSFNASTRRSR